MIKYLFITLSLLMLTSCGSTSPTKKNKEHDLAKLKFGMEVADLNDENKGASQLSHGVIITNVFSFYPASKAGLIKGDLILSLNDVTIFNHEGFKKLLERHKYTYGQVTVDVYRDNKVQKIKVYLN